uniref:Uncharacterized protein n=1 Tax=Aureoumbra lagunensis TaxID=44058 RepID=A0A7S3JWN7_9STRA
MGMKIIDESLSGHCHLKRTCSKNLKVLNRGNGIDLRPCPNKLRRQFFETYKNDDRMRKVDAFLCHHAAGMCEVFMPFNASLIIIVSTRYEIGRHDPTRWIAWNANLKAIAQDPRNIIAANNRYDAEYLKYFTGLDDVPVIPNFCDYVGVSYKPTRTQILVGPGRGIKDTLFRALESIGKSRGGFIFKRVRDLYPHFEYADLAAHPAIILIPYQVSIMSIFEYYRMALPIFVPTPRLLAKWQVQYKVISERSWNLVRNKPHRGSPLPPAPKYAHLPDPNDEIHADKIEFWIKYADFYQWPHIITFDSFEQLCTLLKTTDLHQISDKMKLYNQQMKADLQQQWQSIFRRIFHHLPPASIQLRKQILNYDQAMAQRFHVRVPRDKCVGDQHNFLSSS